MAGRKTFPLLDYPLHGRYKGKVIYRHVRPRGGTYYTIGASGKTRYYSISDVERAIDKKTRR